MLVRADTRAQAGASAATAIDVESKEQDPVQDRIDYMTHLNAHYARYAERRREQLRNGTLKQTLAIFQWNMGDFGFIYAFGKDNNWSTVASASFCKENGFDEKSVQVYFAAMSGAFLDYERLAKACNIKTPRFMSLRKLPDFNANDVNWIIMNSKKPANYWMSYCETWGYHYNSVILFLRSYEMARATAKNAAAPNLSWNDTFVISL